MEGDYQSKKVPTNENGIFGYDDTGSLAEDSSLSSESDVSTVGPKRRHSGQILPLDFAPSAYTVIIGKGKKLSSHVGNKRLRVLATSMLPRYSEANSRKEKSEVISELVETVVRATSPNGGGAFVKVQEGRYWQVDESVAREKCGYVLRDLLAHRYKSSSQSKTARRRQMIEEERVKSNADIVVATSTRRSSEELSKKSRGREEAQKFTSTLAVAETRPGNFPYAVVNDDAHGAQVAIPSNAEIEDERTSFAATCRPGPPIVERQQQKEKELPDHAKSNLVQENKDPDDAFLRMINELPLTFASSSSGASGE